MIGLICIVHYHNQQKYSSIKGLTEENKKQILEAKTLREEVKGENQLELQCSGILEIFTDSHGYIWIHTIRRTSEINSSWLVLRHFQRYSCSKSYLLVILVYPYSQVLVFQLYGCNQGSNSLKQLATAIFKDFYSSKYYS